jgi:hypothetical protein
MLLCEAAFKDYLPVHIMESILSQHSFLDLLQERCLIRLGENSVEEEEKSSSPDLEKA